MKPKAEFPSDLATLLLLPLAFIVGITLISSGVLSLFNWLQSLFP